MGVVFHARQIDLNRDVAIKLLHASLMHDREIRARFEREAHALSNLNHKNIGRFYSYGLYQDLLPFIVMEYVAGQSLRACLNTMEQLPWPRASHIIIQVADSMSYAHQLGVIHRDLSPSNIILLDEPTPDFVKVLDFGLAKIIAPDSKDVQKLTQTGALMGSIHYICPELAAGYIPDARSDIYSLACIFYECITGQVPHQADNPIGLMHKHMNEAVLPPSRFTPFLPAGLEEVMLKGLAKKPENRYQSMKEFISDLELVLADRGTQSTAFAISSNESPNKDKEDQRQSKFVFFAGTAIATVFVLAIIMCFTEAGLTSISNILLVSKPDNFRLVILKEIVQQERLLGAPTAASQLQKRIYEKYTSKKGSIKAFQLALVNSKEARKMKEPSEASYWAWEAIRVLSQMDQHDFEKITKLQEATNYLSDICGAKSIQSGSVLLRKIESKSSFMTDEQYIPLIRLHLKLMRKAKPSLELVRLLNNLAEREIQAKEFDRAISDSNEAVVVSRQVKPYDYIEALSDNVTIYLLAGKVAEAKSSMEKIREAFRSSPELAVIPRTLIYYTKAAIECDEDTDIIRNKYLPAAIAGLTTQPNATDKIMIARDVLSFSKQLHDLALAKSVISAAKPELDGLTFGAAEAKSWEQVLTDYFEFLRQEKQYAGLAELANERITLNKIRNRDEWTLNWTFRLADLLKNKGDYKTALRIEDDALKHFQANPQFAHIVPDCYCAHAITYDLLHDRSNTEKCFRKSIETSTSDPKRVQCIRFWLGRQENEADLRFCEETLSKIDIAKLRSASELASYYQTKALLFEKSRKIKEAQQEFEKALSASRRNANQYYWTLSDYADFCHRQREGAKGEQLFRELLGLHHDHKSSMRILQLCSMLRLQRKDLEAETLIKQELPITKGVETIACYAHLMWIYEDRGDWKQGISTFDDAYKYAKKFNLLDSSEMETLTGSFVNLQMANNPKLKMTEDVIQERIKFWQSKGSQKELLVWRFYLGELYFNREELSRAIAIQKDALEKGESLSQSEPALLSAYWRRYGERMGWSKNWPSVETAFQHALGLSKTESGRMKCLSSLLLLSVSSKEKEKSEKYYKELSELLARNPQVLDGRMEALAALSASSYHTNPRVADKQKLECVALQGNRNATAQQLWELSAWRLDYDLDGSLSAAQEAMAVASSGNNRIVFECRKVMAEAYLRKHEPQKAEKQITLMLKAAETGASDYLKGLIYISATQMYIKLHEPARAEEYLAKALQCKLDKTFQKPFDDILRETAHFYEVSGYADQAKSLRMKLCSARRR